MIRATLKTMGQVLAGSFVTTLPLWAGLGGRHGALCLLGLGLWVMTAAAGGLLLEVVREDCHAAK